MLAEARDPAIPPKYYFGLKTDLARNLIKHQTSRIRDMINDAIDSLSTNPRPEGWRFNDREARPPLLEIAVGTSAPFYIIVYSLDEEQARFKVIAIQEQNFSDMSRGEL